MATLLERHVHREVRHSQAHPALARKYHRPSPWQHNNAHHIRAGVYMKISFRYIPSVVERLVLRETEHAANGVALPVSSGRNLLNLTLQGKHLENARAFGAFNALDHSRCQRTSNPRCIRQASRHPRPPLPGHLALPHRQRVGPAVHRCVNQLGCPSGP